MTTDLSRWPGEFPLQSLYTYGLGAESFFRALKDRGVFEGARCRPCRMVYVPTRVFCERCFGELTERVEVGPQGRVRALCRVHRDIEGRPLAEPYYVACVQLDGASTVLIHKLQVSPGREARVGLRVSPVLRPAGERTGSILDILYFQG